jgi:hypothetical protein
MTVKTLEMIASNPGTPNRAAGNGSTTAPANGNGRALMSVAAAADQAAATYAADDLASQADAIRAAWAGVLATQTREYQRQLALLTQQSMARTTSTNGHGTEAAEPVSAFFGIPYAWWNLLLAGPFQQVAPGGPFRPSKIVRIGEPGFMLAALWRNPAPLPGGPNPSAAQIMSPFRYTVRLETMNLSAVAHGPDFAAVQNQPFGGGFVNIHTLPLPALPQPQEGRPTLYEVNAVVDVLGVGPGLPPFAGFATWVLDPDAEPPFFFPNIPGVGPVVIPGVAPRLQHDTPARFLVYR